MRDDIKNRLICAARQFRHNGDNSPDVFNPRDGFVIAYDRGEVDELVGDLLNEVSLSGWVRCSDQLPKPFGRSRKNRAGILVRFNDGRISHLLQVSDYLINIMKNGPRQPLKFESPTPPRITHWMPLSQPDTNAIHE